MTHLVRCDSCSKVQNAALNPMGIPFNPYNEEAREQWWSRTDIKTHITYHACSTVCRDKLPGIAAPW